MSNPNVAFEWCVSNGTQASQNAEGGFSIVTGPSKRRHGDPSTVRVLLAPRWWASFGSHSVGNRAGFTFFSHPTSRIFTGRPHTSQKEKIKTTKKRKHRAACFFDTISVARPTSKLGNRELAQCHLKCLCGKVSGTKLR